MLASVDLMLLQPYLNAVTNQFDIDIGVQGRRELIDLLQKIPAVLQYGKVDVTREHDVDKAIYEFLMIFLDGVIDKPVKPDKVKCYNPDTGVISLRALIEYKYIDTATKLGQVIDEINADIPAYSNTRDWSWFYVVFYMTEKFEPIPNIFARFAGLAYNWKLIIVMPNGESFVRR